MKELTSYEMSNVSGAGLKQMLSGEVISFGKEAVDLVVGGALGLVTYSSVYALQGGLTGMSKGGGLLGVGVISALVGSVWGAIQGGIWGAMGGAYNGAEWANNALNSSWESVMSGTAGAFKI